MSDAIEDNMVARVVQLLSEEKNTEALATADSLEKYKKKNALALYSKGIALYENNKFRKALKYLSDAAAINKKQEHIWYAIGYTLIALNRLKEAKDAVKYVIAINKEHAGAQFGLFIIGILKNDEHSAVYYLQKAMDKDNEACSKLLKQMYNNFIEPSDIGAKLKKNIKQKI